MSDSKITEANQALTLNERRAFMKLSVEERRRRMAEQARRMVEFYEAVEESAIRDKWQGGGMVEP